MARPLRIESRRLVSRHEPVGPTALPLEHRRSTSLLSCFTGSGVYPLPGGDSCLLSEEQSLPPIRTPEAHLQRVMGHVNGGYPILQSLRGQRRGMIGWALQGHPGRCRQPLARTFSLHSWKSFGTQITRLTPVQERRQAT